MYSDIILESLRSLIKIKLDLNLTINVNIVLKITFLQYKTHIYTCLSQFMNTCNKDEIQIKHLIELIKTENIMYKSTQRK